jgi:hypothetical protein
MLVCSLTAAANASAHVIDSVEVERLGREAAIIVRFNTRVQYLRHTPQARGKTLLIYLRRTEARLPDEDFGPQTIRLPKTDMVPQFSVTYPGPGNNTLQLVFDRPSEFSVHPVPDGRSITIVVPVLPGATDMSVQIKAPSGRPAVPRPAQPVPSAPPTAAPIVPNAVPLPLPAQPAPSAPSTATAPGMPKLAPLSKEEVESRAKEWMDAATQSLAVRKGVVAAERFNQILSLPPNSQSEAAQAMMGEAREFSGELRKARAEYETYLKLYPRGRYVEKVKERLAALNRTVKQALSAPGARGLQAPAAWTTFGSLSQYYYRGQSHIETITPPPPGQLLFNRDTLSLTDQHALISTLDVQARKRDADRDTRIVLRDSDTRNFLEGQRSYNRLNAAYLEQTDKNLGYFVRAGRQVGSGGGIFGRYDGLWLGYNVVPTWRINTTAGSIVEFNSPFKRKFVGASADYSSPPGGPGISLYYIEQDLEGLPDRKAVGVETRYFDPHTTVFGTLDYDLYFKALNTAFVQANWRTDSGINYFSNIDYRKSPPLSLLTALPGQISLDPTQPTLDFRELLLTSADTLGVEELRRQAAILTSESVLFALGFTRPFGPRWQAGADYRFARLSGTGASGILPAQDGTGNNHVVSGQALGNNLMLANDTAVFSTSLILAPLYRGQAYNLTYVVPKNAWRFDGTLRYYAQHDTQEQRQTRLSPSLKVSYRWFDRLSVELESGRERFDETGPVRETHSTRWYVYGGYRLDFQ